MAWLKLRLRCPWGWGRPQEAKGYLRLESG